MRWDWVVQAGVMATHDEEAKKFFKHSSVNCVLAPRYASSKLSYFKQQVYFISQFGNVLCLYFDNSIISD